jgi:hypothetical protein
VIVRSDPGLVGEVDRRTRFPGLFADLREGLILPRAHGLGILLPGPSQRALGREPEFAQNPTDGGPVQPDIELAFHDDRDHVAGPQPEVELQLPWILVRQHVSQSR